ncbi:type II toxin-antitoxin system death-on-curing family toxin [Clavibacter sepedonicus]|uniref:Death on curing protein n=1 Tax=Clavibacter sepedonicus TaxID=31964 RepID=B0RIU2_CLASE|nr:MULTISPECIES: type II toxin-antitoxin system death-on-curing family toxin [Clavibacter]MBD5382401.1 type II toxin-antitoxin system death-on-curing family toxin [Clavibacter sp.]OQJ48275.1 hypothetical protein B5P19_08320 [Clavibacter sepedonicus]OQJ54477.1 hypothetical protein B5P20_10460 [Clavibacter sepedonicus]UUK66046.1 type II toxin-antitoxin system death-on-curing family toxin [Clavibacter sepedonicus]CAQ02727.1 putative death on curing protein [Clavibacter sepedonicus]
MVVALSFEAVVEINLEFGGHGAGVRDANGVHAAVGRAFNGFGGVDPFPSVFDKAAALMHGLATTQYFHDGNKRTAFLSAVAFLELNGVVLGAVEPVEAEVFTLAVAAGVVETSRVAEWFRSVHERRQRGSAVDPRIEYLMLVGHVEERDGFLTDWYGVGIAGRLIDPRESKPPYQLPVFVCGKIHWREEDTGQGHVLALSVVPRDPGSMDPPRRNKSRHGLAPPVRGGHEHHPEDLMPSTFHFQVAPRIVVPGDLVVEVRLDSVLVGTLPFKVTLVTLSD